jgi:hypothetical protein
VLRLPRDARQGVRHPTRANTRIAELERREALAREALDDLADAVDAEGPIQAEDYRRWPAGFALQNGAMEDEMWKRGDGEGIDWIRHLWIQYTARARR